MAIWPNNERERIEREKWWTRLNRSPYASESFHAFSFVFFLLFMCLFSIISLSPLSLLLYVSLLSSSSSPNVLAFWGKSGSILDNNYIIFVQAQLFSSFMKVTDQNHAVIFLKLLVNLLLTETGDLISNEETTTEYFSERLVDRSDIFYEEYILIYFY